MVITGKFIDNNRIVKARLVDRRFREYLSTLRENSPTCNKENIRIFFAIAVSMKW